MEKLRELTALASASPWTKWVLIALGAMLVIFLLRRLNDSGVLERHAFPRVVLSLLCGFAASAGTFSIMMRISKGEIYPPQGVGAEYVINLVFLCIAVFLPLIVALCIGLNPSSFSVWRMIFTPWMALILDLLLILPVGFVTHYVRHPEDLFGLILLLVLLGGGGGAVIIVIVFIFRR